jgi:anion-transporting  ArsA/GET3 family ATPase
VIVCCGSGGVGKTTTSAALAMRAAMDGLSAVVITIDPAKRLATSLGIAGLSNEPADLTAHVEKEMGAKVKGRFSAVMPDTAQTFETFVRTVAGEQEGLAKRVLHTSIYKIFAKEYSGTNEYMAMEKLYELYKEKKYDLIVLDTPPSANTRMFLEAPRLLAEFFDDKIMKWIISPGSKLVAGALHKLLELLERLTGRGFVSELIEFTTALFELRAQFMENLRSVAKLLHQEDVAFLMVTSPERLSKSDTQEFVRILADRGYSFWGFVVNRVLGLRLGIDDSKHDGRHHTRDVADSVDAWASALSTKGADEATVSTLRSAFTLLGPALEHERDAREFLAKLAGRAGHVALVPEQPEDVHSVAALVEVAQEL